MPNSDIPDGSGMFDMPFAPLVMGSAKAVSVTTCVRTSVIIAKYTPRKRRMGRPIKIATMAAKRPAAGSDIQKDQPAFTTRMAET